MTPADLIAAASAAGLALRVESGALRVRGPQATITQWAPRLKASKPELIAHLQGQAAPPPLSARDHKALREAVAERSAIREYEGEQPRALAEQAAVRAMAVYQLLIAMGEGEPPRWLTMLAPGCDLVEARRTASLKFGAERVLEVIAATPAPARTLLH